MSYDEREIARADRTHCHDEVVECPVCRFGAFTRNAYWMGKLMLPRDFVDEQRYVVDKLRFHRQRLHGTGVVCGLKIVQHELEGCQQWFVVLEPGVAIDCCGREIVVAEPEILDLRTFPAVKAILDTADDQAHDLRFCIKYRECDTEPVPVLYDECACDEPRCAPNRILESWEVDVQVGPFPPPAAPASGPRLEWTATLQSAAALRVAVHDGMKRIYVLSGQTPSVDQYSTQNLVRIATATLAGKGLAIEVSRDGTRLYTASAGESATDPARLQVFDTTNPAAFAGAALGSVDIPDSAGRDVRLVVTGDGTLVTVATGGGETHVQAWSTAGNVPAADAARKTTISAGVVAAALGADGTTLYAPEASGTVHVLDTAAANLSHTPPTVPIGVGGIGGVTALCVIADASGELLVLVTGGAAPKVAVLKPDGTGQGTPATLAGPAVAVVAAPGGHWAYVLERPATGPSAIEPVSIRRLLLGEPATSGVMMPIGEGGSGLAWSGDARLYASYVGTGAADSGGVAVLEVAEQDCADLLALHDCPGCDTPDCVVLATVLNYRAKWKLEDPTDPPSDPAADVAAHVARIDNTLGRVVVPSVQDLQRALKCLLESPAAGLRGPAGPAGETGPQGERGPQGEPGVGLDPDYGHICGTSWKHGGEVAVDANDTASLTICFDTKVKAVDLSAYSIAVQVQLPDEPGLLAWYDLDLARFDGIHRGNVTPTCSTDPASFEESGDPEVNAVRLVLPGLPFDAVLTKGPRVLPLRVIVKGDFIRAQHRTKHEAFYALDADHLPKPTGSGSSGWDVNAANPTGDGVEGGTFESWVTAVQG